MYHRHFSQIQHTLIEMANLSNDITGNCEFIVNCASKKLLNVYYLHILHIKLHSSIIFGL